MGLSNKNNLLVLLVSLIGLIRGQLSPTDPMVNEGPCRALKPADDFAKFAPRLAIDTVYIVSMASHSNLRVHAATFLGRLAKDQSEVNEMCLTMMNVGPVMVQTGFKNHTFVNIATPIRLADGLGSFDFSHHVAQSRGVNVSFQSDSIETFLWSDGAHYLIARCINNEFMDWMLSSTVMPSAQVKSTVLDIIEHHGFNRSLAYDLTNEAQTGSPYLCSPIPSLVQVGGQAVLNVGSRLFNMKTRVDNNCN